jgi:hypothetical protein
MHAFVVTVTGAGGSGSATASFTVTAPAAPTIAITSAPADGSTATDATVAYAETGAVTATACELDGAAVSSCTGSAADLVNLAVGGHTFTVEVIGPGGIDTASASFSVAGTPAPSQPVSSPRDPTTPAPILGGTLITTPITAVWTRVSVVPLSACTAKASGCPPLRAMLRFTLAEKARVTIGLFRETHGVRRRIAESTVVQAAGVDRLALAPLFMGGTLATGSYTLTAYATPDHATSAVQRVSTVFRAALRVS